MPPHTFAGCIPLPSHPTTIIHAQAPPPLIAGGSIVSRGHELEAHRIAETDALAAQKTASDCRGSSGLASHCWHARAHALMRLGLVCQGPDLLYRGRGGVVRR